MPVKRNVLLHLFLRTRKMYKTFPFIFNNSLKILE